MTDTDPIRDSGIEDEPEIIDPDEFEEGNEGEEFDYLDGVDVPDPDNDDEVEEADEADFPDDDEQVCPWQPHRMATWPMTDRSSPPRRSPEAGSRSGRVMSRRCSST